LSKIWVGTSGFYYDHWIGKCYPEQISKRDLLPFYAERFTTVEVNSTFYHLPRKSTIEHWLEVTPEDFRFTLKAHRGITHYKKLQAARSELYAFLHLVKPLKPKLGVLLFQLPPSMKIDLKLLEEFLSMLPSEYRCAFEFRHESWIGDDLFALLEKHGAGFCINDFDQNQTPWEVTAPFAYVRMHGPTGRYRGRYDKKQIAALGKRLLGMAEKGQEVYCYFNNDEEGHAWENAQMLMARCKSAEA
jgi:uncharacterized protein YecE (DUF72 family)